MTEPLALVTSESGKLPKVKEYVEWLHQNPKTTLLYGKNNVYVQPILPDGSSLRVPGYLSLHHTLSGRCILKWIPNFLMNGTEGPSPDSSTPPISDVDRNLENLWQIAFSINIEDMVYVHCHKQPDRGTAVVFVDRTGQQQPPLHFPIGGHPLAFLSSLENGLLPTGRLQPPMSHVKSFNKGGADNSSPHLSSSGSQEASDEKSSESKSARRGSGASEAEAEAERTGDNPVEEDVEDPDDFVFRLIFTNVPSHEEIDEDTIQSRPWEPDYTEEALQQRFTTIKTAPKRPDRNLGDVMRRQVLSRAFYGWLAYCRHIRTLRNHLRQLLLEERMLKCDDKDTENHGLTKSVWERFTDLNSSTVLQEVSCRIFNGGCDPTIRKEVWPYLLECIEGCATRSELLDQEICFTNCFKLNSKVDIDSFRKELSAHDMELLLDSGAMNDNRWSDSKTFSLEKLKGKFLMVNRDLLQYSLKHPECSMDTLESLRKILLTYIWENPNLGYCDGMCHMLAILLNIIEKESIAYLCFLKCVDHCISNSNSVMMDTHFANLRSLLQVFDPELFDHMQKRGDYTHLYFTHRWFLFDFCQEFNEADIPALFEAIHAAKHSLTSHLPLFIALALLNAYREEIVDQEMDFVTIIQFYKDMAGKHDVQKILEAARQRVADLCELLQKHS